MTSDRANLRALLAEAVKGPLHADPAEGTIVDASGRQVACLSPGATRRATAELFALAPTVIRDLIIADDAAAQEESRFIGSLRVAHQRAELEVARRVLAEMERDDARALLSGRAEPPTDAEVTAHLATGGTWRWVATRDGVPIPDLCREGDAPPTSALARYHRREGCAYAERWWALDAQRCITKWPKVAAKPAGGAL